MWKKAVMHCSVIKVCAFPYDRSEWATVKWSRVNSHSVIPVLHNTLTWGSESLPRLRIKAGTSLRQIQTAAGESSKTWRSRGKEEPRERSLLKNRRNLFAVKKYLLESSYLFSQVSYRLFWSKNEDKQNYYPLCLSLLDLPRHQWR